MDLRGIARGAAKIIGGLFAAIAIAYLALLAINWRDEPPSADVLRFQAMERARPVVADADNAFVYLLGFAAPAGDDPVALGAKRYAWIERFPAHGGSEARMPGADAPHVRKPPIEGCGAAADDVCARALREHPEVVDVLIADEAVALERYGELLTRVQWREVLYSDARQPMPRYNLAFDAQRVYLLQAWRLARQGDAGGVRQHLDADLRFWRNVLASSELLFTKAIAAGAIRRHFALGNLMLRELPATAQASAVPPAWRETMTTAELSMTRAFAGEWRFSNAFTMQHPNAAALSLLSRGRIADALAKPLYQPQATSNLRAARFARLAEASELPAGERAHAIDDLVRRWRSERRLFRAYNAVGNLFALEPELSYSDYVRSVGDLEGLRRATVLGADLRAQSIAPGDVPAAIGAAELRNPYNAKPFGWNAQQRAITFTGLARSAAAKHEVLL